MPMSVIRTERELLPIRAGGEITSFEQGCWRGFSRWSCYAVSVWDVYSGAWR